MTDYRNTKSQNSATTECVNGLANWIPDALNSTQLNSYCWTKL